MKRDDLEVLAAILDAHALIQEAVSKGTTEETSMSHNLTAKGVHQPDCNAPR